MLTPLNDQIVIKRDEPEEISEGGIVMTTKRISRWATVVAVGPGKILNNGQRAPVDVEEGDHIYIAPLGAEIHHKGTDFVIIREKDIIIKEHN